MVVAVMFGVEVIASISARSAASLPRPGGQESGAEHPPTGWVNRLQTAHADGRLDRELKRLRSYRLLIIDEVGYLRFDAEQANLFFQLIASRYEQGSIVITSNMPFGRWSELVGDDIVASAMIDRLVHHAEVLSLSGDSYRTRASCELLAVGAQPGVEQSVTDRW